VSALGSARSNKREKGEKRKQQRIQKELMRLIAEFIIEELNANEECRNTIKASNLDDGLFVGREHLHAVVELAADKQAWRCRKKSR
jgi:hypothetical protein